MPAGRRIAFIVGLLYGLLALSLAACQDADCQPFGDLTICGPALDFYLQYGGPDLFGYPISEPIPSGELMVQYLENAVLQWPAANPRANQVNLRPLGIEFTEPAEPESPGGEPDCLYFERHGQKVCYTFREFFLRHGGERAFGQPMSGTLAEGDVPVQVFENVKFVGRVGPGALTVRLEAWGVLACQMDGQICQTNRAPQPASQDPALTQGVIAQQIEEYVQAHGGRALLGEPLGQVVFAGDVAYRYYTNACLLWSPVKPEAVSLAPLGRMDAPHAPPVNPPSGVAGFEYDVETGHTISFIVRDFYHQHGGQALFGHPLTEFMPEGERWVQWFDNLRVEWHTKALDGGQLQLSPLGEINYQKFDGALPPDELLYGPVATVLPPVTVDVTLQITPLRPVLPAGEVQSVSLLALDAQGRPVPGVEITLWVATDAGDVLHAAPPTADDGSTWVELGVVEGVCPQTVGLRAVVETADSIAVATGEFALACPAGP